MHLFAFIYFRGRYIWRRADAWERTAYDGMITLSILMFFQPIVYLFLFSLLTERSLDDERCVFGSGMLRTKAGGAAHASVCVRRVDWWMGLCHGRARLGK
jgi:hypothetical protein